MEALGYKLTFSKPHRNQWLDQNPDPEPRPPGPSAVFLPQVMYTLFFCDPVGTDLPSECTI